MSLKEQILWGLAIFGFLAGFYTLVNKPVQQVVQQIGSVASPDIQSPYISFGGVRQWAYSSGLNQASTTVCSFQSPLSTSTLVYASMTLTTGTSTTLVWDIGKATNPTATTTTFNSTSISGGVLGTLVASTTSAGSVLDSPAVFGAVIASTSSNLGQVYTNRQYLNFKYGGAQGALNVLAGSCKAIFVEN